LPLAPDCGHIGRYIRWPGKTGAMFLIASRRPEPNLRHRHLSDVTRRSHSGARKPRTWPSMEQWGQVYIHRWLLAAGRQGRLSSRHPDNLPDRGHGRSQGSRDDDGVCCRAQERREHGLPTCMAVVPLDNTVRIQTSTSPRTSAASRRPRRYPDAAWHKPPRNRTMLRRDWPDG